MNMHRIAFDASPLSSDDEWAPEPHWNTRASQTERLAHYNKQRGQYFWIPNANNGSPNNSLGVRMTRPYPGYNFLQQRLHSRYVREEEEDDDGFVTEEYRLHESQAHTSSEEISEGDSDEESLYDRPTPSTRERTKAPNYQLRQFNPIQTSPTTRPPRPIEKPIPEIWLPPGYDASKKNNSTFSRGRSNSLMHPLGTRPNSTRPVRPRSQDTFRSWISPTPSVYRGVQEETLDTLRPSLGQRRNSWSLDITGQLQSLYQLLRSSEHLDMTNELGPDWKSESFSSLRGNSSEVYLLNLRSGNSVAIKRLAIADFKANGLKASKLIAEELLIWQKLNHPNVLPIQGFVVELIDEMLYPSIVTECVEYGSLIQYSLSDQGFDKVAMLEGICAGLNYLHENNVVHGSLKSSNVMVSRYGWPLLTDYGISQLISNASSSETDSNLLRWLAPELAVPYGNAKQTPTKASDIWALGMTCLEFLSKEVPYAKHRITVSVMILIYTGKTPEVPPSFDTWPNRDQALLLFCKQCWEKDPRARPTANQLLKRIQHFKILEQLPYFNQHISFYN